MKIKWRYFVLKIINIGLDLLEVFEHITGIRNFLRHSVEGAPEQEQQRVAVVNLETRISFLFAICRPTQPSCGVDPSVLSA